jgi:hypothetical protein
MIRRSYDQGNSERPAAMAPAQDPCSVDAKSNMVNLSTYSMQHPRRDCDDTITGSGAGPVTKMRRYQNSQGTARADDDDERQNYPIPACGNHVRSRHRSGGNRHARRVAGTKRT